MSADHRTGVTSAGRDQDDQQEEAPAMRLVMSPQAIAVVRLPPGAADPTWATGGPLVSITKTENETSVICPTSSVPEEVPGPVTGPLVGVYVDEQLDFSQVGILVGLLRPLANAGIPVLTVSTYDTDWILIEASRAAAASSVWRAAGYQVVDAAEHREEPPRVVDVRDSAVGAADDVVVDAPDVVDVPDRADRADGVTVIDVAAVVDVAAAVDQVQVSAAGRRPDGPEHG